MGSRQTEYFPRVCRPMCSCPPFIPRIPSSYKDIKNPRSCKRTPILRVCYVKQGPSYKAVFNQLFLNFCLNSLKKRKLIVNKVKASLFHYVLKKEILLKLFFFYFIYLLSGFFDSLLCCRLICIKRFYYQIRGRSVLWPLHLHPTNTQSKCKYFLSLNFFKAYNWFYNFNI